MSPIEGIRSLTQNLRRSLLLRLAPPIVRAVKKDSLTYLDTQALRDLFDTVRELERAQREGIIIEAGCALGGSAIVMATAKSRERRLCVYDVFATIPPPSEQDGRDVHERYRVIESGKAKGLAGEQYYGYRPNLLAEVGASFARHGVELEANRVELVQGLFEDTLLVREPVALAHIDCDWYQSVMTCLQRIEPRLVPGGRFVIDDYDAWSGCRKAIDEYFADKGSSYEFIRKSRLHIVRR